MSTPTEPHHDVREEWAARLQCADVGVDFPWLTEEGFDVWHEQSEATQEHYRRLLDLALSAGLQIPPTAAVSAAVPMTTTPPPEGTTEPRCEHTEHATRGDGRYGRHFETADPAGAWEPCPSPPVSAAAPDERATVAWNGWIDDHLYLPSRTRDLRAAFHDGWNAALAARPAPVVSGKARTPDKSCISGAAEHAEAAADDERCGWCGITPTHDPGDCAVAQRAEAQRLCDEDRRYTEAADDEGGQE